MNQGCDFNRPIPLDNARKTVKFRNVVNAQGDKIFRAGVELQHIVNLQIDQVPNAFDCAPQLGDDGHRRVLQQVLKLFAPGIFMIFFTQIF